jgi:dihydroorotate dehydrogenase
MIKLSNGHSFTFMAASGAYAFDGRGWPWEHPLRWLGLIDPSKMTVVAKTVTREPRPGNLRMHHPWTCVRLIKDGAVNSVGLTNPGFKAWALGDGMKIGTKAPVIASIMGKPDDLAYMADYLTSFYVCGLEINASCPNTGEKLSENVGKMIEGVDAVKESTSLPVLLKLSIDHRDSFERIVEAVKGKVEAISLNSVPWNVIFPDKPSPLAKYNIGNGGVSGKVVQPYLWPLVRELTDLGMPVIGPSVWEYDDIARLGDEYGAQAFSFGTVCLRHPLRPNQFIRRYEADNTWDRE